MAHSDVRHEQWSEVRLPHPAVLIALWIVLAFLMPQLHAPALLLSGLPLVAVAWHLSAVRFHKLLRRTRWIMLSLLLIYGYATPGAAVWAPGGIFSPTYTGLGDGLLQLGRLVFALAGLSIVLSLLSREQLVAGLYTLAFPLRYLGVSRERLAVRLALTLYYAEAAMADTASDWRGSIENMLRPIAPVSHEIELAVVPFTIRDALLLVMAALLLIAVLA